MNTHCICKSCKTEHLRRMIVDKTGVDFDYLECVNGVWHALWGVDGCLGRIRTSDLLKGYVIINRSG